MVRKVAMSMYICQLHWEQQQNIRFALIQAGIKGEDLDLAMDSRVKDLEDVIDISGSALTM